MHEVSNMAKALWIHDLNPIFFHVGPLQIRYYGVLFAFAILQGYYLWRKQVLRSGRDSVTADGFIWMGLVGVFVGGHVGEVFFYKPEWLLHEPMKLLYSWRRGFSSHGVTIGLLLALWYYSRRYKMPMLEACDRLAMSIPLGASCIRLGNFLNSEVVGRATDVPWAIVFSRYDHMMGLPPTPRHPSQMYEVVIGVAVFVLMYLTDRRVGERRPTGLMVGILFVGYFGLRFLVEFFKEYQVLSPPFPFKMGQLLSIPIAIAGCIIVAKRFRATLNVLKKTKGV
jgi:prolipoprotein diacylglyceryl transferase